MRVQLGKSVRHVVGPANLPYVSARTETRMSAQAGVCRLRPNMSAMSAVECPARANCLGDELEIVDLSLRLQKTEYLLPGQRQHRGSLPRVEKHGVRRARHAELLTEYLDYARQRLRREAPCPGHEQRVRPFYFAVLVLRLPGKSVWRQSLSARARSHLSIHRIKDLIQSSEAAMVTQAAYDVAVLP